MAAVDFRTSATEIRLKDTARKTRSTLVYEFQNYVSKLQTTGQGEVFMSTRKYKPSPDLLAAVVSVSIIAFLMVYVRLDGTVDYSMIFRDWLVGVLVFSGLILVTTQSKIASRPVSSAAFIAFFGSFLWVSYKGLQNYASDGHVDSSDLSIFLERHLLVFLWVSSILVPIFGILVFSLIGLFRFISNKLVGSEEMEGLV